MENLDAYISPEYRDQNRQLHESEAARGKPWGMSGWRYVDHVIAFMEELDALDILDYGCGQSSLRQGVQKQKPYINVYEYDPALPGKDKIPVPRSSVVTCTDVMEHVETEKVPAVLEHLLQLAEKGVFMVIALFDEKHRHLPDGRSPHVTLWPASKWIDEIEKLPARHRRFEVSDNRLYVWLTK